MNTIQAIATTLFGLIMSWKPNTSINNDIEDGIAIIGAAHSLGLGSAATTVAVKNALKIEATLNNIESGQFGELPNVTIGAEQYVVLVAKKGAPVLSQVGL